MSVEPGELRRKALLRTAAVYRVVAVDGELVEVEVVEAPGLEPGERYRFTLAAVEEMERC
jgi:hypothetical protein